MERKEERMPESETVLTNKGKHKYLYGQKNSTFVLWRTDYISKPVQVEIKR